MTPTPEKVRQAKERGKRLKAALDLRGLREHELSKMVGVSQPAINKILNGISLNPGRLFEISRALGVRLDWLELGLGPMEDGSYIGDAVTIPPAKTFQPEMESRQLMPDLPLFGQTRGLFDKRIIFPAWAA